MPKRTEAFMYRTGNHDWRARLFIVCAGLFLIWVVYYLCTEALDPADPWSNRTMMNRAASGAAMQPDGRIRLTLDKPAAVGTTRLIYRGRQNGNLLIDVVIPQLDQGFAYHYKIPLKTAKQGFNLAGRKYILLAANRRAVRIKLYATN